MAAAVLGIGPPSAEAGQINAIAPSCASVGAQVTITGSGFDAGALSLAVGGVPAGVVTVAASTVTFTVPAGAGLGFTTVTATNPGKSEET